MATEHTGQNGGTESRAEARQAAQEAEEGLTTRSGPGNQAEGTVEHARASASVGLHRAASAVRSRAHERGGRAAQVGDAVASRVDRAADYVQQHDTREMVGDARTYPYRHPLQMLGASAFAGFMIGRMIAPKRRRERDWRERMQDVRREMALIGAEAFEEGRQNAMVALQHGRANTKSAYRQGRANAMSAYHQGWENASKAFEEGRHRWKQARRKRDPMWKRAIRLGR